MNWLMFNNLYVDFHGICSVFPRVNRKPLEIMTGSILSSVEINQVEDGN